LLALTGSPTTVFTLDGVTGDLDLERDLDRDRDLRELRRGLLAMRSRWRLSGLELLLRLRRLVLLLGDRDLMITA
jgi:hypothetical protein